MEAAQYWSTELMGSNRSRHGSGVQDSTASVHAWELVREGEPARARLPYAPTPSFLQTLCREYVSRHVQPKGQRDTTLAMLLTINK